ncbi:EF-hand domain-containing protein [Pseudaestuariivita rosea]|uniref:EF-hand domain-containing protein n=1 Tax=Pseudaestuariivita rosea TaxID=2763263 RepID=UPI001ABABEA8|nr:EF-hand domain-containing protein [Pseudaestuariivita rosea]
MTRIFFTAGFIIVGAVVNASGQGVSFEILDTNGDGQLTQAELQAQHERRFEAADQDGNGVLSESELQAMSAQRSSRLLDRFDRDNDGQLSLAEMPNRGNGRMFRRIDQDGDGTLSKAEYQAAQDRFRDRQNR